MVDDASTHGSWEIARLIPTTGISGTQEQERRATSALLAVISAVNEFARTLTKLVSAPSGKIECFTEVAFTVNGSKKVVRPDGVIRVTRGKKTWVALVEVKTGRNRLEADQLNAYLDIARDQGFDALVTISNEISPNAQKHPTDGVDGRKLRKIELHHISWSRLLSIAVMEKEHRGIGDPDQAWILGELIRYLEHPKSGALAFDNMGEHWVSLRGAVAAGTLRASDKEAINSVTANFDALLRFAALRLGKRLGAEVQHQMSRRERNDPFYRQQLLTAMLLDDGVLSGSIRIPDTVGDVTLTADLRAKVITCHVELEAPKIGRNKTRVNWLVRQLKSARDDLRIEAVVMHQRGRGAADLLGRVRDEPEVLITEPKREIVRFRVASIGKMGSKRGTGKDAFIDSILDCLDLFYADVVQHLTEWVAPPPKAPIDARLEEDAGERDENATNDQFPVRSEAPVLG